MRELTSDDRDVSAKVLNPAHDIFNLTLTFGIHCSCGAELTYCQCLLLSFLVVLPKLRSINEQGSYRIFCSGGGTFSEQRN